MSLAKIPHTQVKIQDQFWSPRQRTNAEKAVPHQFKMMEDHGNGRNLRRVIQGVRTGFEGFWFADSDMYKVIEGISSTLHHFPNEEYLDEMNVWIDEIGKAQDSDGYINTFYQIKKPDKKWTNLRHDHEMYCLGHMIEAAVHHAQITGKQNFLNIALKVAEMLNTLFGPDGEVGYCGHPECELALMDLCEFTGDSKWRVLAERMLMNRGSHLFAREEGIPDDQYDGTYALDDVPLVDHQTIKGHAVRAAYLFSGAADLARTGEAPGVLPMLERCWQNLMERRIFLTGGIGPSHDNEGFTVDYDLPTFSAYQETCASISLAMWGYRMMLLTGESHYMDAAERALYNAVLSGVGLDGISYYYDNPLASDGTHRRQPWFDCACCPPNILRTIGRLGQYAYAEDKDSLIVNLYIPGEVATKQSSWRAEGEMPWGGKMKYTLLETQGGLAAMKFRVPEWAGAVTLTKDGTSVTTEPNELGYIVVQGPYQVGTVIDLKFEMPIRQVTAHPAAKELTCATAFQRGPLVYAFEEIDQPIPIEESLVLLLADATAVWEPETLGGCIVLKVSGVKSPRPAESQLYRPVADTASVELKAIPYALCANRANSPMRVWMPSLPGR
ncbi:MAG: glycoside hydrolase family 127 protein [Armatimonadetes bacterium]|nr:glycoside hydrolase family 127 protein [Armatimonadota bacterium]